MKSKLKKNKIIKRYFNKNAQKRALIIVKGQTIYYEKDNKCLLGKFLNYNKIRSIIF